MICRRCIQQRRSFRELVSIANLRLAATDGAAASSQHRVSGRGFTRSALHDAEAVSSSTDILKPQSSPGPPAANSTSAAQPFSTLRTPSPKAQGVSSSVRSEPRTPSSLPAGAQMKGVGYIKAQGDPIAKEDSEYPAWLWTCLDKQSGEDGGSNGAEDGDQFCKNALVLGPVSCEMQNTDSRQQNPESSEDWQQRD
jgi:hypothetical protein